MSSENKNNENQFYCDVCKITISTEAEYALHEFGKKHCDNLRRIAKNKPIIKKQVSKGESGKAKRDESPAEAAAGVCDTGKSNVAVEKEGNFAEYGYFIRDDVYDMAPPKFIEERETYMENYLMSQPKERCSFPDDNDWNQEQAISMSHSQKRKKRKRGKTCTICNVSMMTVPELEAHMRSVEHSRQLKISGKGVTAHFVKAASGLGSIAKGAEGAISGAGSPASGDSAVESSLSMMYPRLYCGVCDLHLNSEQQLITHVSGKFHQENASNKTKLQAIKLHAESPNLTQLHCYSCRVTLNNLFQYNEHKFGKRHKVRCRRLMKEGITIPPEEWVSSWFAPKFNPKKPIIYPELYEKFVLEPRRNWGVEYHGSNAYAAEGGERLSCQACDVTFSTSSLYELHIVSNEHAKRSKGDKGTLDNGSTRSDSSRGSVPGSRDGPRIRFHRENNVPRIRFHNETDAAGPAGEHESDANSGDVVNVLACCSICAERFAEEVDFDVHLSGSDHAMKVMELKERGTHEEDIVEVLLKDKSAVRSDKKRRYKCGFCGYGTSDSTEFERHTESYVHKFSEEEYQNKARVQIRFATKPNEAGKYVCIVCGEECATLPSYNEHLHMAKHSLGTTAQNTRNYMAKERNLLRAKQKRTMAALRRKRLRKKRAMSLAANNRPDEAPTDVDQGAALLNPEIGPKPNAAAAAETNSGDFRWNDMTSAPRDERDTFVNNQPIQPLISLPSSPPKPLLSPYPGAGPREPWREHPRSPDYAQSRTWSPYPQKNQHRGSFASGGKSHQGSYPYQRSQNVPSPWSADPPCYRFS